jgi:rod shape-determining protein MreD
MTAALYLAIPLMVVLVILQSAVLPNFTIFGVVPQLMFVATISWSLLRGLREGLAWAFVAGLLTDLFSAGPIGVTSLAMMATVAAVVFLQRSFPESRLIMPIVLTALATMIFWSIYLLILRLLMPIILNSNDFLGALELSENPRLRGLISIISSAYSLNRNTFTLVINMALIHSILIVPFYWAFYAIEKSISPRKVDI